MMKLYALNLNFLLERPSKVCAFLRNKANLLVFILILFFGYKGFSQTPGTPAINSSAKSVSPDNLSPEVKNMLNYYDRQIYFTENQGQWDSKTLYKADFDLGQAVATKDGMLVATFDPDDVKALSKWDEDQEKAHTKHLKFTDQAPNLKGNGWMMNFINHSTSMTVEGNTRHGDVINFISSKQNHSHVYSYQEIWYKNVYDNVDVRYYPSKDGSLEYDMICKPGFDKNAISIKMDGISKVILNSDGSLALKTSVGDVSLPTPVAYQNINGQRVSVDVHYLVSDNNIVTFNIGNFDASKTLLIDPIALRWATWLCTNSTGANHAHCVWVDDSDNVYTVARVQGTSSATITKGAFDSTTNGSLTLIIGKYIPPTSIGGSGTRVWQTYVGGSSSSESDNPYAAEMGPDGNLYITGYTSSTAFPLTGGTVFNGEAASINDESQSADNIFVLKINPGGSSIKGAVIGGNNDDESYDLRFASNGDVLICGETESTNLATLFPGSGASNTNSGQYDILVFRISSDFSTLRWMRNYGGSQTDVATIMVDNPVTDDIYIAGYTSSNNFPTLNPRQSAIIGNTSGFIQKLNSAGTTKWSSYFDAANGDVAEILCMEFNTTYNELFFGGVTTGLYTTSPTSNISAGAYQKTYGGGPSDFFVASMDTNQTFVAGTYIGGSNNEVNMMGLNTDQNNDVYVLGYTTSTNFPTTTYALQTTNLGQDDEVFLKLYTTLDSLEYSTYYGGSVDDYDPVGERGIKFSNCRIYTLVTSESNNIPLTQGTLNSTKSSSNSTYEPGLVVWANPPDLLNNTINMNQTVCKGNYPNSFTGSVPSYSLPTIIRNNVVQSPAYTVGGSATTYQWQTSLDSINWTNVAGGTTQNLDSLLIGPLTTKTYFRRIIGGDACIIAGAANQVVDVTIRSVSGTITSVACYGGSTGSITANAMGPAPYTYSWSNGQTTQTATNLAAGTYTVTVVDGSGCNYSNSFVVTQPTKPFTVTTSSTAAGCTVNNGTATANPSGGTSPYSYSWNTTPVQTTQTATGLAPGTYTVTVTDAHSCYTVAVAVSQSSSPNASTSSIQNVTCYGGNNGSATVTATGGAGSYTYSWSPSGGTSATASNLSAGTYTVTVTDKNGCTATSTAIITQPTAVNASIFSQTNIKCYGNNSGSATVTASGGTGAYTYSWNTTPVQTSATATGLTAGTYTVTVKDANNCSTTAMAIITQPAAALSASITAQTNVLCYGNNTASATVTASGGTGADTYSWNTTPVQTGATANNLTAGTYTVTVKDANNCSTTATAIITQPAAALSASISSQTNVLCYGNNTGSATVTASGGTGADTYSWNTTPVQTGATANNLTAGTYTVTVKDANNCSTTATAIITQPAAALSASISSQTNVLCYGNNTGSATVTASGGTGADTYSWNTTPVQTGATANNLTAGTYTVTVKDANNCSTTATAIITQPAAALSASISSQTNVLCYGNNTGSATVTASGGTGADTYSWNTTPVQTGATANNLTAGTYTVTVKDANNCSTTATAIITQPAAALSASISSQTNVLCYGNNTGSATVTASGGTGADTYSWNTTPVQTGATANNLTAGTYTVTVKDANNCTTTATAIITQPAAALSASITSHTNVLCYGNNTGSATVTASGGTGADIYSWNTTPVQTSATASGLTAGTYTVTVKDANNCTTTATAIITQPAAALSASITSQTNVLCYGNNTGSATVTAGGGTGADTYSWNTTPVQTGATANNLTAGTYTVTVKDANNCSTTATAIITQPAAVLSASITSQTNVLCYGNNTGSATVTTSGGTGVDTYSWNSTPVQTGATASGLTAGTYTVTVKDANNCSTTATAIITQPAAALSASISSQTNILCYGNNTGSATVTASGGTGADTYSWNTTPVQTSATATGLTAGTYTVTVKDANNCSTTATAIITQPAAALSASISSQTNVLCYGNNTGSATVTASGGTGADTYSWNTTPVQAGATANNLTAGTYTVTIKDANNCSTTATAIITQPAAALSASISSQTNVLCYGNNTGSATVTASGGTGADTYSWNTTPVQTGATANNLTAGTYTVTVKDANNCSTTATAIITQPAAALSASITSQTNVLCYGNNTGSATVTASGGTGADTYSWNTTPVQTGATANNLTAGTYTVTVKDANNCSTTATAIITQPAAALSASITSHTNVLCYGNNTGSATVTATGGKSGYTYSWSPSGGTSATANNLTAGTYTVTVTDANNCSTTATVNITQPVTGMNASISSQTNVLCYGNNTGSATATASGGRPPYTYSWNTSPIQTGLTANNLTAGTYIVTVTDSGSCPTIATAIITQPTAALSASITSQTNALCYGNNTGSATVITSGGIGADTYSWNTTPVQTSATAAGLTAGTYTVTVKDANNCSTTANVTITQPAAALSASITSQTNVLCYGNNTGSATVTASGGTGVYTYSWNTTPVQTAATANSLTAGSYTVTVTDANNCTTTATAIIIQPAAPVSAFVLTVASIKSQTNILCYGDSTGSASVLASGGTGSYTYVWNTTPVQTTVTVNNLPAGTYTVTVTDSNGCIATASGTITQPAQALSASITSQTNVLCYSNPTGSATVTATGGTKPYTYLWSPSGGIAATANNLKAGNYTVTVTDANNCTRTANVTISQPSAALNLSVSSKTNVLCYGNNTGSAVLTAIGGRPPYTYSWSPSGGTSATANNLTAGTYTVTATDSGSCTATATVVILQPTAILNASITSKANVLCYGNNTGSAVVTATGGRLPYTYSWSPSGGTSATADNLTAGTYTVAVTDSGNCTTTATVIITQPQAGLNASITSKTNVLCYGNSSGSAIVTAIGGRPPYIYSWSPSGGTTATANNLTAGTYTVTVTDSGNCNTTATVVITQPQAVLNASISSKTNVLCFGNNTGSAVVTATGGRSPYTYSWSPSGGTAATANNLTAGTYTVTVTDSGNCTATAMVVISQPNAILSASIASQTNVSCFGGAGSASVTATGGTHPYSYSWNTTPIQGTDTANNLAAGTYTVTVTDAGSCSTTATVIISQPVGALNASIISQTPVSCFGGNNGSAIVKANAGTPPYTYSWNTSPVQNSDTAINLPAVIYTVTISDSGHCTTTAVVNITQPKAALSASILSKVNVLCFGNNTGSATVSVNGGTPPYSYTWNTTPTQTNYTAGNLSFGTYAVTVTDSNNCTTTATVVITQPQAGLIASITSKTNVLCYGNNTGSAAVTAIGGRPTYTYSWSPSGGNTATANNLTAGTYTVTVTDSGNCTTTATVVITQPKAVLSASIASKTNVLCFGNNTGSATVTATGGRPPYTYSWSPSGGTSATANNLTAGTYTVTVTDSGSCTTTATVVITQPKAELSASISTKTNVLCFGNNTGSAIVTAIGGRSPYTYSWSPIGGTTATANNLTAGTYTVTVTDSGSCTTTATVIITQPQAGLNAPITSKTNVLCYGNSSGSAIVTAIDGRPPYTYSWSPSGGTTATANNLTAGTYTVIVTDSGNCTTTATVVITQPQAVLNASISSKINVLCFGNNTGSAVVTTIGGRTPYTYSWSPSGGNIATANNLAAGTYTVTVTDSGSCTATATVVITQPKAILSATITSKTNVLCLGNNTGSAAVTATGGRSPYTYSWSPSGGTSATANNLTAGTYTVTVTDSGSCSTTATVVITQPKAILSASITSQTNVSCFGGAGSATVTASGGRTPYSYSWNTTPVQTGTTANNLSSGTYTVMVTDSGNCTTTASVIIIQPQGALNASITSQTSVLCFGGNSGSATVTASAGTPPYTYSWNTSPKQTTHTATNLSAGTYTVTVMDSAKCITTATLVITQPKSALNASINTQSQVLCYGGNTGSATVIVTGGTKSYSYSWNTTPVQTTATANNLPAGTYAVTVTDSNNCTTTANVIITQPQAALSASVTSQSSVLCYGGNTGSATVTANDGTKQYGYSWNTTPVQTTATASNLPAGTYTVTVTDSNNCTTTANVIITQPQAALSASITSQSSVLCYGGNTGSATVTANSGTKPYSYSWNTTPVQTTVTASNLSSGTYTVTVTDSNNCTTTANVIITQPQVALSASIISQSSVLCYGGNTGSATVTVSGGTKQYGYSWSTTPVQTTATASNLPAGTYTVTVTDSNNCTTTATAIITQPQAALGASITSQTNVLCYGNNTGSVTVTVTGGTQPYTYKWDTVPAPGQFTETATKLPGTYTVTVTDSNNCTTTATVVITQPHAPLNVTVSATSATICSNSPIKLSAAVSGGAGKYNYSWSPGGATTDSLTVNPLSTTSYSVTVTDSNGCSNNGMQMVSVNSLPHVAITAISQAICMGLSDTLKASGAVNYIWTPSTGIIGDTTGAVVTASPTTVITYTVTGTDSNGCSNTATTSVNINPLPTVSLSGLNPSYCSNASSVTLIGMPPAPAPYGLYSGTSVSGQQFNPDSAGVGGPYTITYTYINDTTGCKNSASLPVTILAGPNVVITPDSPAVCSGIQVTLQASGADSYSWSPSTGLSSTTGSSVTSNTTSTMIYTVTGTDTSGCSSTASTTVAINVLPVVVVTPSAPNICLGNSVTLNASGGTTYTWSPAEGLSCSSCSTTIADPTTTTQYIVDASNGRCSVSDTVTVGVYSVTVKAGPDQHILYGSTAQLTASGADFYAWTPGNSLNNDSISDPIASPVITTTYTVKGWDSLGCISIDTVVIYVSNPCESLKIPNAFTPSGSINRYFHVLNLGGVELQEFKVFNRWGQMVYETTNIDDKGWDGTFNGKEQPMGTYVYYAEVLCNGKTVFVKGDVELIR